MTQGVFIVILTLAYTVSSYIGLILFFVMWRLTHADRLGLREKFTNQSRKITALERSVAVRNEVVAGVLGLTFFLYSIAGTIGSVRALGLYDLPWVPGVVTTILLVTANIAEMLIAVALVRARRTLNRG